MQFVDYRGSGGETEPKALPVEITSETPNVQVLLDRVKDGNGFQFLLSADEAKEIREKGIIRDPAILVQGAYAELKESDQIIILSRNESVITRGSRETVKFFSLNFPKKPDSIAPSILLLDEQKFRSYFLTKCGKPELI